MSEPRRGRAPDGRAALLSLYALALAVRVAVVAWAAARVPPTADGTFFHVLASRLAAGLGYTWAWPDGAVTPAAHYPVGYPALVALGYAVAGPSPVVALAVNALVGSLTAPAVFVLVRGPGGVRRALAAGAVVALHPALVPYVAAVMTESVGIALVAAAGALVVRARARADAGAGGRGGRAADLAALGVVLGAATLVRPQVVVLAPLFGAAAARGTWARGRAALAASFVALAVCAPWTARNCVVMKQCALVSVNGGWNALIGAQTSTGGYVPLEVPEACRTVWDEAEKDRCFGREARARVAAAPGAFVGKVPQKLAATFDYFGAGPWYLHAANADAFPYRAKQALGVVETIAARLALVVALFAAGGAGALPRTEGPAPRWRRIAAPRTLLAYALAAVALSEHAYPAYLGLAGLLLARRGALAGPPVALVAAAVILATGATHAAFFGGGRYGLVVVPFVVAVAALAPSRGRPRPLLGAPAAATSAGAGAAQAVAGLVSRREESPSSEGHDAG